MSNVKKVGIGQRRENARKALEPYLKKIVQMTFRTGEGRKMRTYRFFVSGFEGQSVILLETEWDHNKQEEVPTGERLVVPLEMVHFVMVGDKGIWP